ncbi:putative sulfate exporter family transporter [Aquincola sp. S2]|uniref:Sulfate exporter family transporter n=1 Tax=Pseudaquabacterium terrae TaxID=2732868 RepID=A0ABX2ETI3_9BURK|nr:putative sulfate exporter family transporter [Aquabacterium terrae]NRF72062.1 putative sulfate exporter family transporter [Aquabacterium terrae]
MYIPTAAESRAQARRAHSRLLDLVRCIPGTGLSGLIALAATFVATLHGGPQFLYALFFGVAFNYLSHEPRTKPGIEFCSRGLLRLGVGLLGARITLDQIGDLGWSTALIVVVGVVTTMAVGTLLGRRLGLTRAQSVLSGGSVAICGASAALAISAVLPREKEGDRFTLMVVVTVTVLSTVAMVLYPMVAKALHLSPQLAGLFLGGTIHDVAQVVGAGYILGPETADIATVVKLFRVAMLTVVVVVVAAAFKQARLHAEREHAQGRRSARQPLVPWFLWLFVAMVALNSAGALPAVVQHGLNDVSRASLVVAIAALGMKTSFQQLARAGWRPMVLILVETLWLALLVLGFALTRNG